LPGWSQTPNAGTLSLTAGFNPDPDRRNVRAGGDLQVNDTFSSCTGYVSANPDLVMTYSGGRDLTISAAATEDVSLVVRTPSGDYLCDDDSAGGDNPMLTIPRAMSGQYRVWAGVYRGANQIVDTVVGFSEVGRTVSVQ
jgi:hypothetical protein